MLDINEIYLGDCLEVMDRIDDKSVDLILCDLPYGTTACKWDTIIPFEPLWKQYKRIVKDNAAIVLTASQPFTSTLVMSNPSWFRVEWIWQKTQGTNYLNANRDPMKTHENIIVFSNGYPTYNPQKTYGKPYITTRGYVGDFIRDKTVGGYKTENDGSRYPHTVQKFNSEKGLHPTQKPVPLFEYLIKTYSNKGDLVLDNCAGSGTTAIACINTDRNYILIEKDETYFNLAKDRIEKYLKVGRQGSLFE